MFSKEPEMSSKGPRHVPEGPRDVLEGTRDVLEGVRDVHSRPLAPLGVCWAGPAIAFQAGCSPDSGAA